MALRHSSAAGWRRLVVLVGLVAACDRAATRASAEEDGTPRFVDLSLLVSNDFPCTWPTFPRFQINAEHRIGPASPYNSDILIIDGNTGTQLDVPPHSVTPPDSGLPNAGRFGRAFTDVDPRLAIRRRGVRHRLPRPDRGRPAGPEPLDQEGSSHRLGEDASSARPRRRGVVLQRLQRPILPAAAPRAAASPPIRCRARHPPGPAPIPTAWSTSPAARS